MSDDESSGSEHEDEKPAYKPPPKKASNKPIKADGLDEASVELLESNRKDRDKMEEEIQELRARAEKRKKQRAIEEKRLAAERAAEEERRKALEEEKKKKKEEEDQHNMKEKARKQAELEKLKNLAGGPNFVISKKKSSGDDEEKDGKEANKKSREQLEAEKKAILSQRIQSLDISGFDSSKLKDKAKDLLKAIYKLEGEKYDLEKRFKTQQVDILELAEKARQANKVGKGGLKRVQAAEDSVDIIQTKFSGTPAKIEMYSKYERQTDKREYSEKKERFAGPQFLMAADKIKPKKSIKWDDDRIPLYCSQDGAHEPAAAEEPAA